MSRYGYWCTRILIVLSFLGGQPTLAQAQIETDNTFSTEVRSSDNLNFVIEAGDAAERNLFHSFDLFSVPSGGSAYFNQAANIQNILSRVTGDSASLINGEIRANGSANVFLINPQGIVFGSEAVLNIGGSFVGSTAQSIQFADGTELNANRAAATPQLTVSRPIGLQLTNGSGAIEIRGDLGNAATASVEQSLALIGNDITFDNASLVRSGGHLEIGSVNSGEVKIEDLGNAPFDYSAVDSFADVQINATSIDVFGSEGGNIQVQGQRVELGDGASLFSTTNRTAAQAPFAPTDNRVQISAEQIVVSEGSQLGSQTTGLGFGNDVALSAETIEISGSSPSNPAIGSRIVSQVSESATSATGGNLTIETGALNIFEGSAVEAELSGVGKGGDIRVQANSIQLQGPEATRNEFIPAEISTVALPNAVGQVGGIAIQTGTLLLNENGALASNTTGGADVGDVDITADTVTVSNLSFIYTVPDPGTTGQAGNIDIDTGILNVLNGSEVSSNAGGEGRAGNVTIQAEAVNVGGAASFLGFFDVQAAILAGVNPSGTGDGGNLSITTNRLALDDGGVVANDIQGAAGRAGELTISAREVSLTNQSIISSASVGIDDNVVGEAGSIRIDTSKLDILENSVITSNTFGFGDAGDIRVRAEEITIQGSQQFPEVFDLSGIVATVEPNANGRGGDIVIDTDRLVLRERGLISSQHEGQGRAGNINITAADILLVNQGVVSSRVLESGVGQAGDIDVETEMLRIYNGSEILADTDGVGNGGEIRIQAEAIDVQGITFYDDRFVASSISSEVGETGTGNSGDISVVADRLVVSEQGTIRNRTQGDGDAGSVDINARQIELSTPQSNLFEARAANIASDSVSSGSAGNVSVVTEEFTAREGGNITVSSSGSGRSGNLALTGRVIKLVDGGELTAESSAGDRGSIDVQVGDLLLLSNSARITTNATETATGGNVFIEGGLVVLNEGSQIVAQAVEGDGGDITIRPVQLLQSDNALISASSELGLDGTVKIERITTDESGVTELDNDVLNPDQLVADSCLVASDRGSGQFLISGSGGLSATPNEPAQSGFETFSIPEASVRSDRLQENELAVDDSQETAAIVEASGFHRLSDGQIVLGRACVGS